MVAPNIQRLDRAERILVELPGITEPERVRNLLQGSANLEFWKTYNVNELGSYFNEMNARSGEYAAAKRSAKADGDGSETAPGDTVAAKAEEAAEVSFALTDSLLAEVTGEGEEIVINKSFIEYFNEPYFAMSGASGPIVGSVSKLDTAEVNFLLTRYKDIFPADVKFKWGVSSPSISVRPISSCSLLKVMAVNEAPRLKATW